MEPDSLAATTVSLLSPHFADAAKQGAGQLGKDAATGLGALIHWLRENLPDHEALTDLGHHPTNSSSQTALRLQLQKLLKAEPPLPSPWPA